MNPENYKAVEALVVFGNVGSDAGYWVLGADGKIHHVGGWNPETRVAFENLAKSFQVLQQAALKQMGTQQGVAQNVTEKLG